MTSISNFPLEMNSLSDIVTAFLLAMARPTGFFAIAPFFSRRIMSRIVRLGVIMSVSFITVPIIFSDLVENKELFMRNYPIFFMKELLLGYFLGFLIWLSVRGLELAGSILDVQRGTLDSEDFNVIFSAQATPTALFLSQVFMGFFFAAGGFLMVLSMLYESITLWPVNAPFPVISQHTPLLFIRFAGGIFFTAIAIILPISGFMFLADIMIAFLARSAPSLNALTFGMPVKSAILLLLLIPYVGILYPKIIETFVEANHFIIGVFKP